MPSNDTPRRVRVGTMNGRQLAALLSILTPYRAEPITAPVLELAARLARLSTPESVEAAR